MKKIPLLLLFLSIQTFAIKISIEKAELKNLQTRYKELLKKPLDKFVASKINKKNVRDALGAISDLNLKTEQRKFRKILKDENVAEAYQLKMDIKDLKKEIKQKTIKLKRKKKSPSTKEKLPTIKVVKTDILPYGTTIYEEKIFDIEKLINQIKTDNDIVELAQLQYQIALFMMRRMDIDIPAGDLGFRLHKRFLENELIGEKEKNYLLFFSSLLHMINYTNALQKKIKENKPSQKTKKSLAKAIIGIHMFLIDLSAIPMEPDWGPEKDKKFIENFAQNKINIDTVKNEFRENFKGLLSLLIFFPQSEPIRLSKSLDAILIAEQANYYKLQKKGQSKYIPNVFYPDDLDQEIIQANETKNNKKRAHSLNPLLTKYPDKTATEKIEYAFELFDSAKIQGQKPREEIKVREESKSDWE